MAMMVLDTYVEERLKAERAENGLDRHDEVWEGIYMMAPIANNELLNLQGLLLTAFRNAFGFDGPQQVAPGGNVSGREEDWTHNYRVPDVIVVMPESKARDCGTHWCGGPDLCVEIVSPGDRSRDKFDFYAAIGVRELMLVDRDPWQLELYRLEGNRLALIGQLIPGDGQMLRSDVVPVSFRLLHGRPRPQIEVVHRDGVQRWLV
jgi:Uma2 family endonuclease